MNTGVLWVLTGACGAGKTTFCRALAAHARSQGWDVAGLLSLPVFDKGEKTAIQVVSLRSGEGHPLASVHQQSPFAMILGKWYFDRAAIQWGNDVLLSSTPCDLLIVDEIGPLELVRKDGWQAALEMLPKGGYRAALAVIRPNLLGVAEQLFDISETIAIDPAQPMDQLVQQCWLRLSKPGSAF